MTRAAGDGNGFWRAVATASVALIATAWFAWAGWVSTETMSNSTMTQKNEVSTQTILDEVGRLRSAQENTTRALERLSVEVGQLRRDRRHDDDGN